MSGHGSLTDFKALLRLRGFSRPKARVWAEFVQQVLQLYWQATDQLIEPSRWARFIEKTGAMGKPKPDGSTGTVRVPMEDAITAEIGQLADQLRVALPPGHFLRRHDVKFAYEKLVPSENRTGRFSKIVDFHATSQHIDAPEIAIEAKPIKSHADIKGQYLGDSGMGCFFTDDSPYTKGPLAAMLAYTITSDGSRMQAKILSALQGHQPAPTQIHRTHFECTGSVYCSSHDRAQWNLMPIDILHLERVFPPDVQ